MKITSKNGEELNFLESGVDGVYVLDHVAFKDYFDEDGHNDWDKSSGKKKLQEWAEQNLPKEILDQFEVNIPMMEEVFSQKMLKWWGGAYVKDLVSKQFPIFKDSDNRMMEFDGKPALWWTRSTHVCFPITAWYVKDDGGVDGGPANFMHGFVPVLRRKRK